LKVVERIETLVVGAGQAGVAMSEHLGKYDIPHLVLERRRIAERWRTSRWDSLVANGPAWHDRFPGMEFPNYGPDAFVPKDKVAAYFEAYAQMVAAPIRCGVEVKEVRRNVIGRPGFIAETSNGPIEAEYVIVATGAFQSPVIPPLIPQTSGVTQLHSDAYKNPGQLPAGAVLVVGSGSSGAQIADELARAGRRVYLSVGAHDRPPRRYRGRDFVWWLGVLNKWDAEAPPAAEHVTIAVSGAHGGDTVDFRRLAQQGLMLLGSTKAASDGVLNFAPDLAKNLAEGDRNYLSVLDEADAYIALNGLDLPKEPAARLIPADPDCVSNPILHLNMKEAGITSIIWATGFAADYSWLKLDMLNEKGAPKHQRGVSVVPGLYFLGLPWQSRRGSSFIWGVWHDAKFVADHIDKQRGYLAYSGSALPDTGAA
jgi:putative flavoprotein involved in K+ transport